MSLLWQCEGTLGREIQGALSGLGCEVIAKVAFHLSMAWPYTAQTT